MYAFASNTPYIVSDNTVKGPSDIQGFMILFLFEHCLSKYHTVQISGAGPGMKRTWKSLLLPSKKEGNHADY